MLYPYQIRTEQEYNEKYLQSVSDPENFWSSVAENFIWKKKWSKVLEYDFNSANVKWFLSGELNITVNCLDRYVQTQPDQYAIIWESNFENENPVYLTYSALHNRVLRCAQMLVNNGIQKGDRVCINMGMIPELAIAVLACARIGAIHSVIFGGFSAHSIADRLQDASAKMIICCDGAFRGEKIIPIKSMVDEALELYPKIQKVIVFRRTRSEITMKADRDVWWHDEDQKIVELQDCLVHVDSEHPLFILYTSGSTGKPKGVVHTVGGYMVYTAYTFVNVFQYRRGEVHFCTADIGWITGHSYIIYGPLLAGACSLMFEGTPTWPDAGRFWKIIDKYQVNIFYTAPTAIRSLMSYDESFVLDKNLSSLRVIGSVGEPINEEAWLWYFNYIGKSTCSLVDTWWQTETGGILISNLAGVSKSLPSFAGKPLPGIQLELLTEKGDEIQDANVQGILCVSFPWPGMIRTTFGDHERCINNYFAAYPGKYFTGDGALKNEAGLFRIIGRVDDVLNVSGHRIGTAELEDAINSHHLIIESAVVGYPHPIKGEGIYAYVIAITENINIDLVTKEIQNCVRNQIGGFAVPDLIQFVTGLPKTRSGKIMRRILRKIAEGNTDQLGDLTSLLDPGVVNKIIDEKTRKL